MFFRLFIFSVILFLSSCNNESQVGQDKVLDPVRSQKKISLPDTFPAEWTEITLKDTKWVIYHPCDGANFTLVFSERDNANFIDVLSGNMTDEYKLISIDQTIYPKSALIARALNGSKQNSFTFEKKDGRIVLTMSDLPYDDGDCNPSVIKKYMIPKNESGSYPQFKQPCKECWGEECDSIH
jgi:hypothetical protein